MPRVYQAGDRYAGLDRVLSDMQERQRQDELTKKQQEQAQAEIRARVLAAYMQNPSQNALAAARAHGIDVPDYQAPPDEAYRQKLAQDALGAFDTDTTFRGMAPGGLQAGRYQMGFGAAPPSSVAEAGVSQATYGNKNALPPEQVQAQRVTNKLDMNAAEADASKLGWDKRTRIEIPESQIGMKKTGAEIGKIGAETTESKARTGLVGAQTGLVGAQTGKVNAETAILQPGPGGAPASNQKLSQGAQTRLASVNAGIGMIDEIEKALNAYNSIPWSDLQKKSLAGLQLKALIKGSAPNIARTMGEVGNLSKDEQAAARTLASPGILATSAWPQLAEERISLLKRVAQRTREQIMTGGGTTGAVGATGGVVRYDAQGNRIQ